MKHQRLSMFVPVSAVLCLLMAGALLHPTMRVLADTFSQQPNETDGVDTFMNSLNVNTNYGTANYMIIGEDNRYPSVDNHALIYFDISSIPSNATISDATLSLWIKADYCTTQTTWSIAPSLRDWTESGGTWNNYDGTNSWTTGGGQDVGTDISDFIGTKNVTATETLDSEIQIPINESALTNYINGTYQNKGWAIWTKTDLNDAYSVHSSSATTAGYRPKLVITYSIPTNTPTATNTSTATNTPTATNTSTATITPWIQTVVVTATFTETFTPTSTFTPSLTPTYTDTPLFTDTPTQSATYTATFTPTVTTTPAATALYYIRNKFTWGDIARNGAILGMFVIFFVLGIVGCLFVFLQWAQSRRMK